jgi:hypothetical protein
MTHFSHCHLLSWFILWCGQWIRLVQVRAGYQQWFFFLSPCLLSTPIFTSTETLLFWALELAEEVEERLVGIRQGRKSSVYEGTAATAWNACSLRKHRETEADHSGQWHVTSCLHSYTAASDFERQELLENGCFINRVGVWDRSKLRKYKFSSASVGNVPKLIDRVSPNSRKSCTV